MVAGIGGSSLPEMRATDRVPYFTSGIAYPDYSIFDSTIWAQGTKGVLYNGYFSNEWKLFLTL
jgi:hypothetical protein